MLHRCTEIQATCLNDVLTVGELLQSYDAGSMSLTEVSSLDHCFRACRPFKKRSGLHAHNS